MKHIFTIHSPLTFLVAYSIVESQKINKEDVILLSKGYEVPIEGFRVVPAFEEKYNYWFYKFTKFNVPINHDRYINDVTNGEEFIAYVDLVSYYQKILITNTKCRQFHLMEEGNSAYMEHDDLADLTWEDFTQGMKFRVNSYRSKHFLVSFIRVLRGYNLRLISLPYHYMAYTNFESINFYCFSYNAFYNAPRNKKIQVKPSKNDKNILKLAKEIELYNEVIWADGSNGRYTGLSEDYYYNAIDRAIRLFKEQEIIKDKVYVKLRPGLKNIDDNYLVSALKKANIKVEVLPSDVLLECLYMVSRDCSVIGNLTASLEYAHVFGHQAYSIYGLFEKQPPNFLDRMAGFWKNVKKVKAN